MTMAAITWGKSSAWAKAWRSSAVAGAASCMRCWWRHRAPVVIQSYITDTKLPMTGATKPVVALDRIEAAFSDLQ